VTAIWLFLRSESRRRWRAWLSLALIVGIFTGGVVTAAAGARRTGSAYARFLTWSKAPDALVGAQPYDPRFASFGPATLMRLPQAVNAAVVKSFGASPRIVQFLAPASDRVPGQFWARKILSGRLADPRRPDEVNVSFTLAQRLHLRAGGSLRLVMVTAGQRRLPLVFRIAGIDAAQSEFPPQPGNGTFIVWGTPAFYRDHPDLTGFVQVALRFRHGSRDWPAVRQELSQRAHGKFAQAELLSVQSVNTQRSIRPQAVALWLLAALFGVIGLLVTGQLLARLSFLEAAEYGTLRALGVSRAQLVAVGLARAALIGAAGGIIGVAVGVALSPLLPVGLARVAEPHPGIDADIPILAAGLAVAIMLTVACAAWPGWRAAAEGPLARLTGSAVRPAGWPGFSRVVAAGPVPLAMGVRLALHRGAGRTAVPVRSAVASATLGVAALSGAIVFAGSLSHLLTTPLLYGVTWDAMVSNGGGGPLDPALVPIRGDRQVAAWTTAWTGAPMLVGGIAADAIALPVPGGGSFVPAPVTGRLPRTSREIALGTQTLRQVHARIGATIGVSVTGYHVRPMTIVGTTVFPTLSDTLDLGYGAGVTPAGLHYLVPAKGAVPPPDTAFVRFRPGIAPEAGRQALTARLAGPGNFLVDGPATPTDLLNFGQVRDLPQVLGTGLGAVALLTIAHLLITAVRRRQRDLAILRAMGFTSGQVRSTIGWQALTLAGLALLIGLPLGIACGRLGWQVFANQLGVTPVVVLPFALLAGMAAGWVAAAIAVAALPAEAAVRSRPAAILRGE
jgi:ABC-type lipoprotein release transport system permease subunit